MKLLPKNRASKLSWRKDGRDREDYEIKMSGAKGGKVAKQRRQIRRIDLELRDYLYR